MPRGQLRETLKISIRSEARFARENNSAPLKPHESRSEWQFRRSLEPATTHFAALMSEA